MPLAALLLMACGAEPGPALLTAFAGDLELTLAADDNGPPPGSPYPPPPPLVQDPWRPPANPAPPPGPQSNPPPAPPQQPPPLPVPQQTYPPPPAQQTYPLPAPPQTYPPPAPQQPYPPPAQEQTYPPPQPPPSYYPPPQQSYAPAPAPKPPETPPADVGSRLTWGVGAHLGFGEDQFNDGEGSGAGLGIGIYVRLGEQLNDLLGAEAEVSAGTILISSYLRTALTFDITPVDWFTFAVGPMAREDVVSLCGTTTATSLGATIRFDFHIGSSRSESGRGAFTLGLVGDLGGVVGGTDFTSSGPAEGIFLTVGWAHY